jgi:4-hydroxy-tetrahydrodipicolinate synthase
LAEDVEVDAVSVLYPFYLSPSDEELYNHYKEIAESTRLPVMLYSNLGRTGMKLSSWLVSRLDAIENIVVIKDYSGDLQLSTDYLRSTSEDFVLIMGTDTLILSGLMAGAKGAIAAISNIAPELVVRIYESFRAGNLEAAKEAQNVLLTLRKAFTWGTFPVVIMEALDLIGMDCGPTRSPIGPMRADQRQRLKELLESMGKIG